MNLPPPAVWPLPGHRSWATLGDHKTGSYSHDADQRLHRPDPPAERTAYWTEAICRSFAGVETKPLGSAVVSGHFEFVEIGGAKLADSTASPQCYTATPGS
jgi:hypothetical protein